MLISRKNKMIGCLLLLFAHAGCNNVSEPALIYSQQRVNDFVIPEKDTATTIEVLYRSSNNGKTWFPFSNGIPANATVSGFALKTNKIFLVTVAHGAFVFE